MSMRDEAAVQNLCWAAMDFAHASKSLEEDEITLDEYNRVSARLEANKARLLALLAPEPEPEPSAAEVEAGARAIYDVTWNDDAWHLQDENYRKTLRQRSKAALAAARQARAQAEGERT